MGRFANALRNFARGSAVPAPTTNTSMQITRAILPLERDYARDIGSGAGTNLALSVIGYIANAFMEAPLSVVDGEEAVARHPMVELIRRPNKFYSGGLLWYATLVSWLTMDNAYWLVRFSAAGGPVELWWVPPWMIEPKGGTTFDDFITHYEYRVGGRTFPLDPSEVVHLRWGIDPENPRKGQPHLKALLREVYSDEEAARFTATLLRNFGVPGIVLSPKGDISIPYEQAQERKAELIQKTTGDHRGEPVVMTSATDVQEFGFTPAQMDLANIRAVPEARFCAMYQVPAAVVGLLTGMKQTAVGATMRELRELAYESGIVPKQAMFAEELDIQLLPFFTTSDTQRSRFDISKVRVLQDDQNALATRWVTMLGGPFAKRSEARAALKLPVDAADDVFYEPSSIIPAGPGAPEPPPVAPGAPPPARFARSKRATRAQLAYLRQLDRSTARVTSGFAADLSRTFDDLGKRAEAIVSKLKLKADPGDEGDVSLIIESLNLEDWRNDILGPVWRKHILNAAQATYGALHDQLEIDIGIGLPDPVARQVLLLGGRQLGLLDLDAATRHALFEALASGRAEGLGPIELARRIRQYVGAGRFTSMEAVRPGSGVRYRSELTARTETLNAQRVAVAEVGKAAGYQDYLAFDNRTGFDDEECLAMDGRVLTYTEMLEAMASEHPNGTRSFAPVPGSQLASSADRIEVTECEYDDVGRLAGTRRRIVGEA